MADIFTPYKFTIPLSLIYFVERWANTAYFEAPIYLPMFVRFRKNTESSWQKPLCKIYIQYRLVGDLKILLSLLDNTGWKVFAENLFLKVYTTKCLNIYKNAFSF